MPVGSGSGRDRLVLQPSEAAVAVYHPKSHYRIVFEEGCVPLSGIKSLRHFVFVLMKACRGA